MKAIYQWVLRTMMKDQTGVVQTLPKREIIELNTQITADVMFNWRSFMHFQGLRNKPDAQLEIREIADTMLEQVKNIEGNPFEHSISAFGV